MLHIYIYIYISIRSEDMWFCHICTVHGVECIVAISVFSDVKGILEVSRFFLVIELLDKKAHFVVFEDRYIFHSFHRIRNQFFNAVVL